MEIFGQGTPNGPRDLVFHRHRDLKKLTSSNDQPSLERKIGEPSAFKDRVCLYYGLFLKILSFLVIFIPCDACQLSNGGNCTFTVYTKC